MVRTRVHLTLGGEDQVFDDLLSFIILLRM